MGIIVPDTLITGKEFKLFRKNLIESYNLSKIIELPERIFPKTDAQTHILIIEKADASSSNVEIFKSDVSGNCVDNISINKGQLVQRMDFKFHSHFPQKVKSKKNLSELNPIIERGTPSYKEVRETGQPYIHTTNFPDKASKLILKVKYLKIIKTSTK